MGIPDYDRLRRQLRREAALHLKEQGITPTSESGPKISVDGGKVAIEVVIPKLEKSKVLELADLIGGSYHEFSGYKSDGFGYRYTFNLSIQSEYRVSPKSTRENRTVVQITTALFGEAGSVRFEKEDGGFQPADIECALKLWKQVATEKTDAGEEVEASGVRVFTDNKKYTWECLAGYDALQETIGQAMIKPFLNAELYRNVARLARGRDESNLPRAVLFEGPPGTGKTTTARIVANESGVPLVYVPLEKVLNCWYGESEKRLGEAFDGTAKLGRRILFIDEIDSLAADAQHEATRRVLSVLLRKIDGFASDEQVLTVGATNKVSDLEPALMSRFARRINFALPNTKQRAAIFQYYAQHLAPEQVTDLAARSGDRSGRDIVDVCADAERVWADRLVSSGQPPSPPSHFVYLHSLEHRK